VIVRWAAHFRADLKSAYDFTLGRSPQGARRVVERIVTSIDRLADTPHVGRPGQRQGTRELVVTGTPYIVIYEIGDSDVVLLRLLHGAQRWPPEADQT
jgi:addiction module RelE/StbE family toxin